MNRIYKFYNKLRLSVIWPIPFIFLINPSCYYGFIQSFFITFLFCAIYIMETFLSHVSYEYKKYLYSPLDRKDPFVEAFVVKALLACMLD